MHEWASQQQSTYQRGDPLWHSVRIEPVVVRSWGALCRAAVVAVATSGCSSIPPGRSAVANVSVSGNEGVTDGEILGAMVTRESPRFLGVAQGIVYDYEIFNRHVLERDMGRIERKLRARGYYEAKARAGRVRRQGDDRVRVEIIVEEGPLVVTRRVATSALDTIDADARAAIDAVIEGRLPLGEAFDEEQFEAAEAGIERVLTDRGRAWAKVTRAAEVDLARHEARAFFAVEPGPTAVFGEVRVEGLAGLPEGPVRHAIDIEPGDRYSTAKLEEAQLAVLDLGAFSAVRIVPDLSRRGRGEAGQEPPRVPLRAVVTPTKLYKVSVGGGLAFDSLKSEVHLVGGWSALDFLGGMRRLSIEARPGLVLHPLRINNWEAPERPLFQGRLDARLDQPGLFEARTKGFLAPSFKAYPVLLRTDIGPDDPVLGYFEQQTTLGAERTLWRLYLSLRQHFQYAMPFAYVGELGPLISDVVLFYPEILVRMDLTDNRQAPRQGLWVGTQLQSAFVGDAQDLKVVPQVRAYAPLGPLTLVLKSSVGFLWALNYGDTLLEASRSTTPPTTEEQVRDLQLMFFRGLYAGGPQSNRGYPPRTISPYAVTPFITPTTAAQQLECSGAAAPATAECTVPVGGLTLWEASLELLYPIHDPLAGSIFCDAADAGPEEVTIRFDHPNLSCGLGFRYGTPAGPIRLDVGYRIPGAQVLSSEVENPSDPGTVFGAPINISVGIGETF
jgi:outer membrane protein insertion porin family/translocation and assembly module TamA